MSSRIETSQRPRQLRWQLSMVVPALFSVWCVAASAPAPADAAILNLGVISYDVFIPSEIDAPGINAINIFNFTGDPLLGGFALEPDFPSLTDVSFLDSSLSLGLDGVPTVFDLGTIGPGPFEALSLSAATLLSSLTFSATLSATNFLLADGSIFSADSPTLTLTLLPTIASSLVAGFDFGVLSVQGDIVPPTPVPEPGVLTLMVSGLVGLAVKFRAGARRIRSSFDLGRAFVLSWFRGHATKCARVILRRTRSPALKA